MKNVGKNRLPSVKNQVVNITLNLSFVAIVYVVIAAITASLIQAVFSEFNEAWKKQPITFQLIDVGAELSLLVIASFWVTYFVHFLVPVFAVDTKLEYFIETYAGHMVFVYAVFLFAYDLNDKLLCVYDRFTGGAAHQTSTAV
jgi:hypothetical protein